MAQKAFALMCQEKKVLLGKDNLSPEGLDTILSLVVQTGVAVTIWSKFINWHRNKKNK